jgi:hypothetical protein
MGMFTDLTGDLRMPIIALSQSLNEALTHCTSREEFRETRLEKVDRRLDEACGYRQQSVRSEAVGDRTSLFWQ